MGLRRPFRVLAPAKVNLYLKVVGKRPDGFHELDTLFESIDAHDVLTFREIPSGIRLTTNRSTLPNGPKNLVYRAADLIRSECGVRTGVRIHLEKRLPVAAGLGGGSSDAATTLLALNKLWKLELPLKKLLELAGRFGSDIPFFVLQKPFAVGRGRGEVLRPVSARIRLWHVLVTPRLHVLAKDVYGRLNAPAMRADGSIDSRRSTGSDDLIPNPAATSNRAVSALVRGDYDRLKSTVFNSLEAPVLAMHPALERIKQDLILAGANVAIVSGSGPTVFGLIRTEREARAVANRIRKKHPSRQIIVTSTALAENL